jgi:hypothetical protein
MRRQVRVLIGAALTGALALAGGACKRTSSQESAGGAHAEGAAVKGARVPLDPLPAGAVRVSGKNFHVDVAPAASCATGGAACSVLADLTALSGFKVNKDYPYRFVPDPASQAVVDGEAAFAVTGTHTGRLMVPVKRDAPGAAQVSGTFKLSVCSADVCQIEDAVLTVALGPGR